jgi:alpha-N-arabinofuranosidase
MISAGLVVDRDFVVAPLDRRVFGTFVEHMGRCVYTGIFEPGHPAADSRGFRRDVLELVRELGPTLVRYPGGNFLSGYDWEDGVGPVAERPTRLDLAWFSTETNRFGTNEFMEWCRAAGVEPMLGVNLGTRGPDAARRLVEYCNHPGGSTLSDLRRRHGYSRPHGVKLWCLGNEMDGPWQICRKTADEYGRAAHEAAKVMRWVDPTVQLSACGSSSHEMATYGAWEERVLEHCYDEVDFLSLHTYFEDRHGSTAEFLANAEEMDRFIREVGSIADAVGARKRSRKRMMLSFDEWNVWTKARTAEDMHRPGWPEHPRLIEEVYDCQDALLVGGALIVLMNNADRVQVACLAQLVNVIGPIMTEPGGPAWRQTIFHPFALASRYGRGRVLRAVVRSPAYQARTFPEVPYLCAAVVDEEETGTTAVFAMNRHPTDELELRAELRGLGVGRRLEAALSIHHPDVRAVNTREAPHTVVPVANESVRIDGADLVARLPPLSWNVLVSTGERR